MPENGRQLLADTLQPRGPSGLLAPSVRRTRTDGDASWFGAACEGGRVSLAASIDPTWKLGQPLPSTTGTVGCRRKRIKPATSGRSGDVMTDGCDEFSRSLSGGSPARLRKLKRSTTGRCCFRHLPYRSSLVGECPPPSNDHSANRRGRPDGSVRARPRRCLLATTA